MPLLTQAQMDSLSQIVESGMQTDVLLRYRTVDEGVDSGAYGSSETFADGPTVKGWMLSYVEPSSRLENVSGERVVVHEHRLFLPLGTTLHSGDKVVADGSEYFVTDDNLDSTWKTHLTFMLRKVE